MGEPEFSSNKGLIHGFRSLGHNVEIAGIPYWGRGNDSDIVFPDKQFPEVYSYRDILEKSRFKEPIIIQLEPHFFLSGPRPPEIKSVYYFTDAHAAGAMWYKMSQMGNFNTVFCAQKYHIPLFETLPCRVEWLPPGFDDRRFKKNINPNPQCHLSFIGYSGIAEIDFPFQDQYGKYTNMPDAMEAAGLNRYATKSHTLDYAERAELLLRLCRDFDVRIYGPIWDAQHFQGALQTGVIGFHRSLLHDIAIRIYEVMAAELFLVTDRVPFLEESIGHAFYRSYNSYYKPFLENFDLEYKYIKNIIVSALKNPKREAEANEAKEHAWQNHTWTHRAKRLLEIALN